MLRSGAQEPVNVKINNIRTLPQLCGKVAAQIDVDSATLCNLLTDGDVLTKYGFDSKTCLAMFIPDTYEMYWNTTERGFVDKMYVNYNNFWNEERQKKAKALNLTRIQVATLASIVQCEQSVHREEQPTRTICAPRGATHDCGALSQQAADWDGVAERPDGGLCDRRF